MGVYETGSMRESLHGNSYVGRGIVIGKSEDGRKAAIAYFIMGRSENSRNRVFSEEADGEVVIYPYDYSRVEDPSLIIYSPVKVLGGNVIVTNGDQTDTVYAHMAKGGSFEDALKTRCFEPDAPNLTPRISGILQLDGGDMTYKMSILKSADAEGSACNRYTFSYEPVVGVGHFIHTYQHDGSPIPTFCGEPERVRIPDSIDELTDEIWENLDEDNRISLYVRYMDLKSGACESRLINKNKK